MNHSVQPAAATLSPRSLFYWPPFWFFIFLVLAVSAVGYAAFQQHKTSIRQDEMELLATIADLKVEEITKWREERKWDAARRKPVNDPCADEVDASCLQLPGSPPARCARQTAVIHFN